MAGGNCIMRSFVIGTLH